MAPFAVARTADQWRVVWQRGPGFDDRCCATEGCRQLALALGLSLTLAFSGWLFVVAP